MLAWGIVLAAAAGYLLGNCNGALIVSGALFREDVRTKGSGNAGLTNFFRNYGGIGTLLVILIDAGKAALACFGGALILKFFGQGELWSVGKMVGGSACVIGHILPVFFRFHGGKGVLCAAALCLCMNPLIFLILFAIFVISFVLTHYVSLGSVLAAASYPFAFSLFFWKSWAILALAAGVGIVIILLHLANLRRLLSGTESKVYLKKR